MYFKEIGTSFLAQALNEYLRTTKSNGFLILTPGRSALSGSLDLLGSMKSNMRIGGYSRVEEWYYRHFHSWNYAHKTVCLCCFDPCHQASCLTLIWAKVSPCFETFTKRSIKSLPLVKRLWPIPSLTCKNNSWTDIQTTLNGRYLSLISKYHHPEHNREFFGYYLPPLKTPFFLEIRFSFPPTQRPGRQDTNHLSSSSTKTVVKDVQCMGRQI